MWGGRGEAVCGTVTLLATKLLLLHILCFIICGGVLFTVDWLFAVFFVLLFTCT